jgi:hypothetical protein
VSREPHKVAQEKEAKMDPSTYLSWFRRLLILGAVVAGLSASAAGARLDPGTPPDVSDVASALSTTPPTIVSRPPDVRDVANTVNAAAPDAFERYAAEHPYGNGLPSAASPIDRIIAQEQSRQRDLALFSLGFSARATSSDGSTPPDVQDDRPGPLGTGEPTSVPVSDGSGFAWDDWAIGVGAGLGIALFLGIGLVAGRQQRHRVQPV